MRTQTTETDLNVILFTPDLKTNVELPLLTSGISAGFPSPALDFIDLTIDLNKYLVERPSATFYGRVQGESMRNAGINDGDLLVIDKSIKPAHGKIAVCYIDGGFTLKRLSLNNNRLALLPENENYNPILVDELSDFQIWGIVTYIIKKPR